MFSFSEHKFFLLAVSAFSIIFVAFFPAIYTSIDEHAFLKNAILLREGKVGEKNPELACRATIHNEHGFVASQFIGRSIALVPFTYFGLGAVMLSGLFIHLVNAAIFYFILRRLKIDPRFTVLYLFFPVLLWESRTLYSELLVLTGFLAGFYFYIREGKFSWTASGFCFGLSALVRYDAVVGFVAFGLPLAFKNRQKLFQMAIGFVPLLFVIVFFNSFVYSGPFNSGYGTSVSLLSSILSFGVPTFMAYLMILAFVFPGMLVSPVFFNGKKFAVQFAILSIAYLIISSRFTDFFSFPVTVENIFISRLRYLLPLLGLLLIPYSFVFQSLVDKLKVNRQTFFWVVLVLACSGAVYASVLHYNFTESRRWVYDAVQTYVPKGALLIGSSDDCMYSMAPDLTRARYLNVSPYLDLGSVGNNINLLETLGKDTYILDLSYSNLESRDTARQQVINQERAMMENFILENSGRLGLIFSADKPHRIKIYKWKWGGVVE